MQNLFYRNSRLSALVIGLILVSGLSSFALLPRMEDPLLTPRFAMINTRLPGADAERVESLVSDKIENELHDISEIKEIRSVSRSGVSTITLELRGDVYEVDTVWSRIRDRIDEATVHLPPEASDPEFDELDVKAYAQIVALKWAPESPLSPEPNNAILRRLAEDLKDVLEAASGTEKVDIFGDPDEEMVVEISAADLAAYGLTVDEVARQLAASDAKVSSGDLRNSSDLIIEIDGELDSMQRIARTPVQYGSDGRFVPLSNVATIRKNIVDPPSSLVLVDGQPAIALGVMVRSTMRLDTWSAGITEVVEDFAATLPRGIELTRVFDQNRYVESRLTQLLMNLLMGALAVAAVILLMMGWRSALIVSTALPLAALMVLAGMRGLGIPIHQMSVTGLIIALGLLIDNAIVIVDEVGEKLKSGLAPADAVSESVRHLAIPLFGSTLTTALAFAPIALMPGPAGEFVGSIAISVILAISSSFLLAVTIVPALSAWGLRAVHAQDAPRGGFLQHGISSRSLTAAYRWSLGVILRHPLLGMGLGVILPVVGFVQWRLLPEQFFPPADRDQFQIEVELPSESSLSSTLQTVQAMRDRMLSHDEVVSVTWFLGESAPSFYYNIVPRRKNTSHYAQALVQLKSTENARGVINRLQEELDREFREARTLVRQLEQGPPFDAPVEVRLYGPDLAVLRTLGNQMRLAMSRVPSIIHTRSDLAEGARKLSLKVDEEAARLSGLDHQAMAMQIDAALDGAVGGTVLEATEELPVRVRSTNDVRGELSSIASLDLLPAGSSSADSQVPLTALADIELVPESSTITRLNGRRMNEVQGYLRAGVLPAEALHAFEAQLAEAGFRLPPGYSYEYGGEAAKRDDAVGDLMANVGVLLVMMAATLVLSFSSFRIAGIIGAVAFLSAGLAFAALWVFGYPFGFMAIVGTMGLMGVAVNDAIVVLAAIRENPRSRVGDREAVRNVVVRSTRHVVATSLTTIAGFVPLLLGGGGFWPPLAVAIAGGVGGATVLALYFAPSAYVLLMCPACEVETAEAPAVVNDAVAEPTPGVIVPAGSLP